MPFPSELCPAYAPLVSAVGFIASIGLCCIGAAYGTAKSGVGVLQISVHRPDLMMKSAIAPIMAGIIGLYGLLMILGMKSAFTQENLSLFAACCQLIAGVSTGLAGLASGLAIGVIGDAGVRGYAQQTKLFTGMILVLIFAEVVGLYGLIIGFIALGCASVVRC